VTLPFTPSFVQKYLEPADTLGEVLFGLVMVLTFTLGASLAAGTDENSGRTLLVAAIGCNFAWGIIDGVMYAMNAMFDRGRATRIRRELEDSGEPAASALIARELGPRVESITSPEERSRLYRSVLTLVARMPVARTRLERADVYGGIICFWLVFLTASPAVVPFLVIDNPRLALRISNGLLVAMLFVAGYTWASQVNANRLGTALAFTLVALLLVGVAIALGG
jgi:hypothetical protein